MRCEVHALMDVSYGYLFNHWPSGPAMEDTELYMELLLYLV